MCDHKTVWEDNYFSHILLDLALCPLSYMNLGRTLLSSLATHHQNKTIKHDKSIMSSTIIRSSLSSVTIQTKDGKLTQKLTSAGKRSSHETNWTTQYLVDRIFQSLTFVWHKSIRQWISKKMSPTWQTKVWYVKEKISSQL